MSKCIEDQKVKKVLLEDLIQKKLKKDNKRDAVKDIYIESLGGCIKFKNPSDAQLINFSDKRQDDSYTAMMTAYEELIYDCCPMLQSQELQEKIEVNYPYDTVRAIFDISEITTIGLKLLNFFDDEDNAEEKLKN